MKRLNKWADQKGRQFALWEEKRRFRSTRADFYEDLAEVLSSGGELVPELKVQQTRAAGRKKQGSAMLFGRWLTALERDSSLANALRGYVPDEDIMIISAGEENGDLPKTLHFLAKAVRIAAELRSAMVSALAYPLFCGVLMIVLLVGFAYGLIPIFSQIYPPSEWPFMGQVVYWIAQAVVNGGPFLLVGILAIGGWFKWSLRHWAGPLRVKADRYVPYRLYRDFAGGNYFVVLASLIQGGMAFREALVRLRRDASPWLRWYITATIQILDRESNTPAKSLSCGIIDQRLADRVEDFGRRGKFEDGIVRVGLEGIDKIIKAVKASAAMLKVGFILCLGVLIVTVFLGVGQVAYELDDAVQSKLTNVQKMK